MSITHIYIRLPVLNIGALMKTTIRHVSFEGHKLAVLCANQDLNQPAIIFIPGVMAPINFWKACLPQQILEQKRWYSISLPGHHPSVVAKDYKPSDIDEIWINRLYQSVIKQLVGKEKVIVVGHSTGGFSALNLAANNFDQLSGVISIAGFYHGKWGGIEGQLTKLAHLGLWAKPLFIFNLWLGRLTKSLQRYISGLLAYDRKAYFNSPVTNNMLNEIQSNMQEQKLSALFPLFNRIPTLNIHDKLSNIKVPTVIMAGSHDPVISAEQSLILAGLIKPSTLIVFENAGHMPFMERTEQFNCELTSALSLMTSASTEDTGGD